jgi:hypothetical protein
MVIQHRASGLKRENCLLQQDADTFQREHVGFAERTEKQTFLKSLEWVREEMRKIVCF